MQNTFGLSFAPIAFNRFASGPQHDRSQPVGGQLANCSETGFSSLVGCGP